MAAGHFTLLCMKVASWGPPELSLEVTPGMEKEQVTHSPCTCISVRASRPSDLKEQ